MKICASAFIFLALALIAAAQNPPFIPLVDSAFQNSFFVSAVTDNGGVIYRLHFSFVSDTTSPQGIAALSHLSADAPSIVAPFNTTKSYIGLAVAHNSSRLFGLLDDGRVSAWDGTATSAPRLSAPGTFTHVATRLDFPYPGLYLLQQAPTFSIVPWNPWRNVSITPAIASDVILPTSYATALPANATVLSLLSYRDNLYLFYSDPQTDEWRVVLIDLNLQTVAAPQPLVKPADTDCDVNSPFFLVSNDWIWVTCARNIWRYDFATTSAAPILYTDMNAFASPEWTVKEFRLTSTEAALVVLVTRPDAANSTLTEWNVLVLANRNTTSLGTLPALFFDWSSNVTLPKVNSENLHLAIGPFQFPSFVSGSSFLKNLGEQIPYKHIYDELRYDGTLPDVRLVPLVELSNGRRKLALPHDLFAFGAARENWPPLLTPRNFVLNTLAWTATRDNIYRVTNYTAFMNVLSGQPLTRLSILTEQVDQHGKLKVEFEVQNWPFKTIQSALEIITVLQPQSWSGSNYTDKQTGKTNFYTLLPEPVAFAVKGTAGAPLNTLEYDQHAHAVGTNEHEWRLAATWNLYRDSSNYNLVVDVPPFPYKGTAGVLITGVATFPAVVPPPEYHYRLLIAIVILFVILVAAFVVMAECWWKKGHPHWPPAFLKRRKSSTASSDQL